jgi:cytochrome b
VLEVGAGARWFQRAKWLARSGLGLRFARRLGGTWTEHAASACFMASALCFRFAWVYSGRSSARDDEAVARMARARATRAEPDLELRVVQHR